MFHKDLLDFLVLDCVYIRGNATKPTGKEQRAHTGVRDI
jgi:hypothetical protein